MLSRFLTSIFCTACLAASAAADDVLGFEFTQPEPAQAATLLESGDAAAAEKLIGDAIKETRNAPRRLAELRLARAIVWLRSGNAAKAKAELPSLTQCKEPQIVSQARVVQEVVKIDAMNRGDSLATREGWNVLLNQVRDDLVAKLDKQHAQLADAAKAEKWNDLTKLRESSLDVCEQIEAIRLPGPEAKRGYREQALTLAEAIEVLNQLAGRHRAAANNLNKQISDLKGPEKGHDQRERQNAAKLKKLLDDYNSECRAIDSDHDALAKLKEQYTDLQNRHPTKVKEDKRVRRMMLERNRPKPRLKP